MTAPDWYPPLRDALQFWGGLVALLIVLVWVIVNIWQIKREDRRRDKPR